jgi:hypothetical protein
MMLSSMTYSGNRFLNAVGGFLAGAEAAPPCCPGWPRQKKCAEFLPVGLTSSVPLSILPRFEGEIYKILMLVKRWSR